MPITEQTYPTRNEVIQYLSAYEQRYQFLIVRPVHVDRVESKGKYLDVYAGEKFWRAKVVVSATGTWRQPFIPDYPGQENFQGTQLHSAHYLNADSFKDKKVIVVGGGIRARKYSLRFHKLLKPFGSQKLRLNFYLMMSMVEYCF